MRHRVISNLRYCANMNCPTFKGIPPIKVNRNYYKDGADLKHAMDSGWDYGKTSKEINHGKN